MHFYFLKNIHLYKLMIDNLQYYNQLHQILLNISINIDTSKIQQNTTTKTPFKSTKKDILILT